ncbi:MAG: PAS domain S-box protein, partial [Candidatus Hermodarchaeota archaeon]|nr:PAS domain S-box protein [Candidatus Hermodarchaeota archaeon]
LRIERDRAQRYLEISGVMFLGINTKGEIFLINPKGCKILGYTEEELIGKNYFDLCLPEDERENARLYFEQALAGKVELKEQSERPIVTKDGSIRLISWHTSTLNDDKGNITGLISSGEDITKRTLAESAVKASEEKFRSLVENTADWVWEVDSRGRFTYSNSSVEDIMGITAGQVIGRTIWEFMKPEEIEHSKTFFNENISNHRGFKNVVNHFFHRDGNLVILEANARPIVNLDSQVAGFRGVFRDITQRMRADDILRESEARYRALVETSPDAITVLDIDGNILLVNNRTVVLLGYDEQKELLGRNCFDFLVPEQRAKAIEALQGTVEGGTANPVPFTLIHKDNTTFPAEISASILVDGKGNPAGYIIVTRDITQHKAAEHELEEAKARAEFFTDLMAHDLNNINQAILSALEIALLNHDITSDLRSQIQVALDQVERSSALIGRVKKFSQIGAAKSLLEVRDVEPDFRSALKAVKQAFPAKTIRVDTNIHPGEFQVLADDLLVDLFYNLLHNAVKFDRKEKCNLEVKASNDANRRFLRIEVIDYGPGIPEALKKLIFARYTHRVDERAQGSGIGLTLVHQIITRYGGKIWVENRVEGDYTQGSKFIVLLPLWS